MSIVVFGSIKMDLVTRTPRLPAPGETLIGHDFVTVPGGKGANQAVACAKLGAQTYMVGRVGGDAFGMELRQSLQAVGVAVTLVEVEPVPRKPAPRSRRGGEVAVSSGIALIAVDDTGQNNIIVIPGANGRIAQPDLARLETALDDAQILLLQLEIPLAMVVAAAKMAHERGILVMLDPAPAQALPAELYPFVDVLTPNETETAVLTHTTIHNETDATQAAQILLGRGTKRVVIKMGSRGAYVADSGGGRFYEAVRVTAVDTVAAGDAFNGALAVALSEGHPFDEAMRWAIAGGALAVTQPGAQAAMPDRSNLFAFMG
jgi:ribokinase